MMAEGPLLTRSGPFSTPPTHSDRQINMTAFTINSNGAWIERAIKDGLTERERPPHEALLSGLRHISDVGLSAQIKSYGDKIHTYVCILLDAAGAALDSGYGKGLGVQPLAGAVMEALEHYYSQFENLQCSYKVMPSHKAFAETPLSVERPIDLVLSGPSKPLAVRQYSTIDGASSILWPLALTCPFYSLGQTKAPGDTYDYSVLRRYSSNSGTAIGRSFTEAAVHSVCELIERDALSLFLLDTFVRKGAPQIRLVDQTTLPADLQAVVTAAEQEIADNIHICEITSAIGVPAFICVPASSEDGGFCQYGSGASLSERYALLRAVTELCQLNHLVDKTKIELENLILGGSFERYPVLMECSRLNISSLIDQGHYTRTPFRNAGAALPSDTDDLTAYLSILLDLLAKQSIEVYFSTSATLRDGLTIVSAIAPQLEKFNLVLEGSLVLPGPRGRKILTGELS